ncbi:Spc98 family-domain-containing protein [Crepidotus variabilis]|uniref:Spindle pole body component n=1 Tax=Crepidotus variabilis TaxID=179855 RepID=A0A9P6JNB4_9AGAR|nr:Spc98 family-domain-containing protein [Crepidotus variabilis]
MSNNPWPFDHPILTDIQRHKWDPKAIEDSPGVLQDLPRIMPHFFVPALEDKPQNPIMESLGLEKANTLLPERKPRSFALSDDPSGLSVRVLKPPEIAIVEEDRIAEVQALWLGAVVRKSGVRNSLLSWDRLRKTHANTASPTAFISEQEEFVYTSARHHVHPRLFNPRHELLPTTQHELLASLKSTVLGISSNLHAWEPTSERFVHIVASKRASDGADTLPILLVDGKDEVISTSFVERFLKIGTLLRRLELLLVSLRTRSAKEGPTIHALAHTLSETLEYIRESLVECPPTHSELANESSLLPLAGIWSRYALLEELLVSLSELCGRDEPRTPDTYLHIESSPSPLLSRIYDCLSDHSERQSPTLIRAVFAFILTTTSQEYIQDVSVSVGFGGKPKEVKKNRAKQQDALVLDDEDEEEEEDIFDMMDAIDLSTSFPTFFPQKVSNLLPAAQKSLVLLRIAQPNHPFLSGGQKGRFVRWFWTEKEVEAKWNDLDTPTSAPTSNLSNLLAAKISSSKVSYKPELSDFASFDLEPGVTRSQMPNVSPGHTNLRSFIRDFPPSLPPITPTLSSLTLLAFRDLMNHASTLSSSLLSLFIEQPGKLNFKAHLELLRSFLLVAKPGFKMRLLTALFDDAGEFGATSEGRSSTAHSMSVRALRLRKHRMKNPSSQGEAQLKESKQPWAVGLAPHLLERETWPPVGADLSFFLRTVIVDSLEGGQAPQLGADGMENGKAEELEFFREAEWRLGFAIKDLPKKDSKGRDRAKWLDPLAIEALDFLYMDYKPPKPLEILIPADVLAKYQRMFAFILRLFRVESALKSLFRMSTHRTISTVLFPTFTESRQLLLHFRFVSQAFISSLSGYIFDTAIGGNFDPFLGRLTNSLTSPSVSSDQTFSDVFELAQSHSNLLDDILSACLLRSGQKGVGELLRQSMELVLEFTIVVGELHRGRIQEYEAAPMVEQLYGKFCIKMTTFTQVLKGIVDKSPSSSKVALETNSGNRRPTGGLDALYHLLIRLDLTDWWGAQRKS